MYRVGQHLMNLGSVYLLLFICSVDFQFSTNVASMTISEAPEPNMGGGGIKAYLRNGSISALYTASTLVYGGQICVHVARETTAAGYFLSCR